MELTIRERVQPDWGVGYVWVGPLRSVGLSQSPPPIGRIVQDDPYSSSDDSMQPLDVIFKSKFSKEKLETGAPKAHLSHFDMFADVCTFYNKETFNICCISYILKVT